MGRNVGNQFQSSAEGVQSACTFLLQIHKDTCKTQKQIAFPKRFEWAMMKNRCNTSIPESNDSRSSVSNAQHLCALAPAGVTVSKKSHADDNMVLSTATLNAELITIDDDIVRYRVFCDQCEVWHYHGPQGGPDGATYLFTPNSDRPDLADWNRLRTKVARCDAFVESGSWS